MLSDKQNGKRRIAMNENKRVTFRLNEEEIEKFKVFSEEQGINQAEAFVKLIEAMGYK